MPVFRAGSPFSAWKRRVAGAHGPALIRTSVHIIHVITQKSSGVCCRRERPLSNKRRGRREDRAVKKRQSLVSGPQNLEPSHAPSRFSDSYLPLSKTVGISFKRVCLTGMDERSISLLDSGCLFNT